MPPIVFDIYDLYVSIHASKSNCMVVPAWRVIRHGLYYTSESPSTERLALNQVACNGRTQAVPL